MIIFSIILSLLYWVLWSGVDAFIFDQGNFVDIVFNPSVYIFWSRLTIVSFLTVASAYFQLISRRQKKLEEEAKDSYDLIPSLLDRVESLVVVFDSLGRIIRFNNTCERITGYSFEEVKGKHFWEVFLNKKDAQTAKDDLSDLKRGEFPKEYEDPWICKDGSLRLIKWANNVVFDNRGFAKYVVSVGMDITTHQQAEGVLKKTEEGYKSIIDNIRIGVSLVSPQMELLYMNKQMKKWFSGKEFSETSACHNIFSNFSKDPCKVCPTCKALASKETQETLMKTNLRGARAVYKVISFPVENKEEQIIAVIETVEDFTKINRQEEEIRHSYRAQAAINSLLRFSLESVSLEGFLKCALNIILSAPSFSSDVRGAIFLVEKDPQVLTLKVQSRLPQALQREYRRIPFGKGVCGRAAASGDFQFDDGLEKNIQTKSKTKESYASYCSPIIYAGNIVGAIGVYLEKGHKREKKEEDFLNTITTTLAGVIQRKKDEHRLSQTNECLLNLGADSLDNIQQLVTLCGDILGTSSAFYNRINFKEDNYDSLARYKPPAGYVVEGKYSDSICSDVINKGEEGVLTVYNLPHSDYIRKDPICSLYQFRTYIGQTVKCRGKPIGVVCGIYKNEPLLGNEDKKFLGIIASAIGIEEERIKASEELSHASAKLEEAQYGLVQSEKLAALGRFSSGIAHEVKNPLGIILGGTEYLERKLKSKDNDVTTALKKIKESTLRADTIVRNLIKFAMPSEIKKEKIIPKDLVEDTLSLLKYRLALVNVDITTEFSKENIYIEVDSNQLHQVLFNLFINSIDAMSDGGGIKVKTYKASGTEFSKGGSVCVIEVTDTGEGISAENLPKIFEPFFTTKRGKKGTGLGLAMSKTIVENHNGSLLVNSQPNKGTEVRIVLPIL